jgi:hypothetical protein
MTPESTLTNNPNPGYPSGPKSEQHLRPICILSTFLQIFSPLGPVGGIPFFKSLILINQFKIQVIKKLDQISCLYLCLVKYKQRRIIGIVRLNILNLPYIVQYTLIKSDKSDRPNTEFAFVF